MTREESDILYDEAKKVPEWFGLAEPELANLDECPACGGEGLIPNPHHNGDDPESECALCDGKGSVPHGVAFYVRQLTRERNDLRTRNAALTGQLQRLREMYDRRIARDNALPADAPRRHRSTL